MPPGTWARHGSKGFLRGVFNQFRPPALALPNKHFAI
jgi:hypothetical protein